MNDAIELLKENNYEHNELDRHQLENQDIF